MAAVTGAAVAASWPNGEKPGGSNDGGSGRSRLPRQLGYVHELLEELGSIDWARREAGDLAAAAREELPRAFAGAQEGPDLDFIRSLASFVVERRV